MNTRVLASAVVALLAAALIAGCGGGDGDDTATASIGKAQFIEKADAICATGSEHIQSDLAAYLKEEKIKLNENQTESESAALVHILATNVEKQIEDIRALGVPSGDEDEVEAILSGMEEGVNRAEEDPAATVQGELDAFGAAGELARDYGLKACAQG